jgi:hypothetical protein
MASPSRIARRCSWSTAIAVRAANLLDKIRNVRYAFRLTESISRSPVDGREDEKLRLFETLVHNLRREAGAEERFFIFFTCNSLKKFDSEKKMKGNKSKFTSV